MGLVQILNSVYYQKDWLETDPQIQANENIKWHSLQKSCLQKTGQYLEKPSGIYPLT